ncbi:hypothetical protein [Maridesulfovibrio bastinii]|uniref:hypothetical protein n=1 Tax=Maridesulfovibrio bastinii TaxID=47157 RepID=UPI0004859CB6|nr:hypothetical protein [Maridesulfovibrio bastinii]
MKRLLIILLSLSFFSGCALVDRDVELTYHPGKIIQSGHEGKIYIEKPQDVSNIPKNKKGLKIIGNVKNSAGMETADIVTASDIGDWIAYAYAEELAAAGYEVETILSMPESVPKGISFSFKNLVIDTDMGFMTLGGVAEVSFDVIIWGDDEKIATVRVEGKGQERSAVISNELYGVAARNALTDAVSNSLPRIIKILEED